MQYSSITYLRVCIKWCETSLLQLSCNFVYIFCYIQHQSFLLIIFLNCWNEHHFGGAFINYNYRLIKTALLQVLLLRRKYCLVGSCNLQSLEVDVLLVSFLGVSCICKRIWDGSVYYVYTKSYCLDLSVHYLHILLVCAFYLIYSLFLIPFTNWRYIIFFHLNVYGPCWTRVMS